MRVSLAVASILIVSLSSIASPSSSADSATVLSIRFDPALQDSVASRLAGIGKVAGVHADLGIAAVVVDSPPAPAIQAALRIEGVRDASVSPLATVAYLPDDSRLGEQWAIDAVSLTEAWDVTRGSHAVKVAILDTGIQYLHEDLRANTALDDGACGPDADFTLEGVPAQDDHGHGTHVAGIAALLFDANPALTAAQARCILGASADDLGEPGKDANTGSGRVNAAAAVAAVENPASIGC